jgi:hypothetical protein
MIKSCSKRLGDHYVKDLIVIGLFEGIQNIGGPEIE